MSPSSFHRGATNGRHGSWGPITSTLLSGNTVTNSFSSTVESPPINQAENRYRANLKSHSDLEDEPSVFDPSDRIKIVVTGDSNVGKTSLVYLLCNGKPQIKPSRTVGCNVEVMIHRYPSTAPDANRRAFFVEFYDLCGYAKHPNSLDPLYAGVDGAILVFDLNNSKSRDNLSHKLVSLGLNHGATGFSSAVPMSSSDFYNTNRARLGSAVNSDPALLETASHDGNSLPLLLAGNKLDRATGAVAITWASSAVGNLHLSPQQMRNLTTIQVNSTLQSSLNEAYPEVAKFLDLAIKRKLSV